MSHFVLNNKERDLLVRIRTRLSEQGLSLNNEKLVTALLRAAAALPEAELIKLLEEGLDAAQANPAASKKTPS